MGSYSRFGLDRISEFDWQGRRVGLLTNRAAVNSDNSTALDCFLGSDIDAQLVRVFSPEHGFALSIEAGHPVPDEVGDIPIVSLYHPGEDLWTPDLLEGLEVLVCDLPDVGARYFTHLHTFLNLAKFAAVRKMDIVVPDRPNPVGGKVVQGNVLLSSWISPVGAHTIPMRHGMTFAELIRMVNQERKLGIQLHIIPCEGWHRETGERMTGTIRHPFSPNISRWESLFLYPGTCLVEGTNVSEGRGTEAPFCMIGAPWLDAERVMNLTREALSGRFGIETVPCSFVPNKSKFKGIKCEGVRLNVGNADHFDPCQGAIVILCAIISAHPSEIEFYDSHFDRLAGTDLIRKEILAGTDWEEVVKPWETDCEEFLGRREPFLFY